MQGVRKDYGEQNRIVELLKSGLKGELGDDQQFRLGLRKGLFIDGCGNHGLNLSGEKVYKGFDVDNTWMVRREFFAKNSDDKKGGKQWQVSAQ
jgi:hypothetical protein